MFFDLFWTDLQGNPNICWWCRTATPACTPACGADTKRIWPLKAKRSFAPRDDRSYVRLQRHGWWWFLRPWWGQALDIWSTTNFGIWISIWLLGVTVVSWWWFSTRKLAVKWANFEIVHDMQSRNASCFSLLQWHSHCTCLRQDKTMPIFISCGVAPETWSARGITAFWKIWQHGISSSCRYWEGLHFHIIGAASLSQVNLQMRNPFLSWQGYKLTLVSRNYLRYWGIILW